MMKSKWMKAAALLCSVVMIMTVGAGCGDTKENGKEGGSKTKLSSSSESVKSTNRTSNWI